MVTLLLKDEEISKDNAINLSRKVKMELAHENSVCLDAQGLDEPTNEEDAQNFVSFIDT